MLVVCTSRHGMLLDQPSAIRANPVRRNTNTPRQALKQILLPEQVEDAIMAPRDLAPVVEAAMGPVVLKDVMDARLITTVSTRQHLEELFRCTPGIVPQVQNPKYRLPHCPFQRLRRKTGHCRLRAVICWFLVRIAAQP